MTKLHASPTYTTVTITIAAIAAVVALALVVASPSPAGVVTPCATVGSASGGSGNDRMCGTTGANTMLGLAGNDNMTGSGGNDRVDGGDGTDIVDGDSGNDVLIGGPGPEDLATGDSGDDDIRLRDGSLDHMTRLSCGSGRDFLDLDLTDALLAINARVFGGCEGITVGAVNEGPNVVISKRSLRVGEDGRAVVGLTCPASLAAPCKGKLRIGRSQKSEGAPTTYSIDPGTQDKVAARLSRRDRRKLDQGDEITAHVTSVEQGEFGDKTTIQTVRVRKRHT